MAWDASQFSLADFYYSDSDNPLTPPADYLAWRRATAWATSLYEPVLCDPPGPINQLQTADGPRRVINMTSYGYLGLARPPAIIAAARQALDDYGTGACGSPILPQERAYQTLEQTPVDRVPAVLSSTAASALGCASGLMRKGDVAIVDARAAFRWSMARRSAARSRSSAQQTRALDEAVGT